MVPTLTPVDNDHEGGLTNSPPHAVARATGSYPHPSYYTHHSATLGPPPGMPYHQGPPALPEYRGYYPSPPSQMHRNYGPSYQDGGSSWLGAGGGQYYQPPPLAGHYPSPPQHYESAQQSATVHSQSSAG